MENMRARQSLAVSPYLLRPLRSYTEAIADLQKTRQSCGQPGTVPAARHVLVVDDDPFVAFAVAELLRQCGHRVSEAHHAREALELDAGDPADLLITDLNMPDMDGHALMRRVRARRPTLPVIILTGRPPRGGLLALGDAPMAPTELLRKPATSTDLTQALKRILDN